MLEDGDADVVDVIGEPVSRGEARRLGFGPFGQIDVMRDAGTPPIVFRLEQLPPYIADGLAGKLERAEQFLRRNELDAALALAHEVLWEYPSLVAAKVVIARSLIARKACAKAQSVLQAIPEAEKNGDVLSCIALSQSGESGRDEGMDAHPHAPPLQFHIWILFAAFLAGLFLLWLNIMAVAAPERYAVMRSRLPAGWTFLPGAGRAEEAAEKSPPAD